MSVLALLVAATPLAPVSPTPEVAQEITVMARKLKDWKGGVSKLGGRMICRTRQSSGDKALDAIRCGALLNCMKPLEPRIDALMGSKLAVDEKKTRFARLISGVETCAARQEAGALARLAEDRTEDRLGT